MKKITWLALACSMLMMGWASAQTNSDDSNPLDSQALADAFAAFRSTGEPQLTLKIDAHNFSLLHSVATPATEAQATARLRDSKLSLPEVRVAGDTEVVSFPLDSYTWLEKSRTIADDHQGSWTIRSLEPLASFPRASWSKFIEFALRNGFSNLTLYNTDDEAAGFIYLTSVGADSVTYGAQRLMLSPRFYESMRVSPEYPAATGPNGFVVLVHDPHANVIGRYDLMLGLEALVAANPQKNFEFLVEGAFPQRPNLNYAILANRKISDGGLTAYLKTVSDVDHRPLVYSMLRRYMVDTPLAFKLLHSELNIPAYAIDDNRYLKEVLVNYGDERAQRLAILKIIQAVGSSKEVPEKDKDAVASAGLTMLAMLSADLSKASDIYLVEQKKEVGDTLKKLATLGAALLSESPALKTHIAVLQQAATAYTKDATTYKNALLRNNTMAPFIAIEGKKAAFQLAIAFIGNYHTQGITTELRKQGIGYVVIEPRRRLYSNQDEANEKRFQRFLANPDLYFSGIKAMNKGLAGLTSEQVVSYHKPLLEKRRMELRKESSQPLSLSASAKIKPDRLRQAMNGNGSFAEATVQYGVGNIPPKAPPPPGAFGFVEPNDGKGKLDI
jgi:hypothetical protein